MESSLDTKKPSRAKTIWLIIAIFLFAVSNTMWGLFYFKQNQDNDSLTSKASNLSKNNDELSSKAKRLDEEVVDLNKEIAKQKEESESITWRSIPEMKLKYKLDVDTEDLTYTYLGGTASTAAIVWTSKSIANKSTSVDFCDSYSAPLVRWGLTKGNSSGVTEKKVGQVTLYSNSSEQSETKIPAICKDPVLNAKFQSSIQKAFESLEPANAD